MKRIVVLGSTGSIGRQTLDIVRQLPDQLQIVGLAANRSAAELQDQAREFGVADIALMDEKAAQAAGIPGGMNAVVDLATLESADLVVVAVAGVIGLQPTLAAIEAGKQIALASKEVLVAAGHLVMPLIKERGVTMTPIDSEHSAIFQCLQGYEAKHLHSIILTASGGPFRGWSAEQIRGVTLEQALNHPTWRMGGKITIDSASMMNKGLEMIEAHWLFGLPISQVEVVVHPQSIVHSMVRFHDGSVLGQMGWPDMRLPIQYALVYPERLPNDLRPWNPAETPHLTFENVDESVFRSLTLARRAASAGGLAPCIMNAANEEAVNAFLKGQGSFAGLMDLVESVMDQPSGTDTSLGGILVADAWAREQVRGLLRV